MARITRHLFNNYLTTDRHVHIMCRGDLWQLGERLFRSICDSRAVPGLGCDRTGSDCGSDAWSGFSVRSGLASSEMIIHPTYGRSPGASLEGSQRRFLRMGVEDRFGRVYAITTTAPFAMGVIASRRIAGGVIAPSYYHSRRYTADSRLKTHADDLSLSLIAAWPRRIDESLSSGNSGLASHEC